MPPALNVGCTVMAISRKKRILGLVLLLVLECVAIPALYFNSTRYKVERLLGQVGPPSWPIAMLIKFNVVKSSEHLPYRMVIDELVKLGSPAVPALGDALADSSVDISVRLTAAEVLGMIGDKRALSTLLNCMKDGDVNVRIVVIDIIGRLHDRQATQPLIDCLHDSDEVIRFFSIEALGAIKDPRAFEPSLASTRDKDGRVRSGAVESLANLGDKRALPRVLEMLTDTDSDVRRAAVNALGELGGPENVESLMTCTKDSDRDVVTRAWIELGRVGDTRAFNPLVVLLLAPEREQVGYKRGEVISAIGNIDHPDATAFLKRLRDDKNEDENVRQAAQKALAAPKVKN